MKFLLEVLGMTNYCNLNCDYCDWEKKECFKLDINHIVNMKRNIKQLKEYVDEKYPEIQIVEYSGGEPFVYPEVIKELLDSFSGKWVRIVTNGLLVKDEHIQYFKNRGKVYVAVSLDGHKLSMNNSRFHGNENKINKVIETIDKLLENEIPTMILCTISQNNIVGFSEYVSYLENRFSKAIEKGMLVFPAHSVCDYGKDRNRANHEVSEEFINFIANDAKKHPLINKIIKHYESLGYFLNKQRRFGSCRLYDWSVAVHFRGKEIVEEGNFCSFGCGMRGLIDLGNKNINIEKDKEDYFDELKEVKDVFENPIKAPYQCKEECFVDWEAFNLILNKNVTIDAAAKWFVLFKDRNVQKFIENYRFM